jgi:hypothetical protein
VASSSADQQGKASCSPVHVGSDLDIRLSALAGGDSGGQSFAKEAGHKLCNTVFLPVS